MELETKTTITVRFWNHSQRNQEPAPKLRAMLEDKGIERALEMMQQGCTGGVLNEEVDGITYEGWFEIDTQIV